MLGRADLVDREVPLHGEGERFERTRSENRVVGNGERCATEQYRLVSRSPQLVEHGPNAFSRTWDLYQL